MVPLFLITIACLVVAFSSNAALAQADDGPRSQTDAKQATKTARSKPATTQPAGVKAKNAAKSAKPGARPTSRGQASKGVLPVEPKQVGGEPDSIVQIANLVYAGTKSSKCFSDHFLSKAERQSAISTSRRFHAVKLSSGELFSFPMVIMTGEGSFRLSERERENLRQFVEGGGFLLASAGCSSEKWDRSFRQEIALIFPESSLKVLGMEHPVFHTVYEIRGLRAKRGRPRPLEGIMIGGRLGVIYSQDGLNDTAHVKGCCCCGGNEITNAVEINVNVLAHALIY